jgi:hypothetical protein
MKLPALLLGVGLALAAGAAPAQDAPAPSRDWKALARQDVLAAYESYVANHPGMYDPLDKGFPERLKRARDAGLRVADSAAGSAGYADALGAFSAELSDGHALAFAKQGMSSAQLPREWPGFIAAWRGARLLVHQAAPGAPAPAGSEIVGCDGLPAGDFVKKRLGYRGFRPKEAGHWWARSSQAFFSTPLNQAGRPDICTFRGPDGRTRQARLTYSAVPEDFTTRLGLATDGERTAIGLTEPRPGIFLVGMPDFQPDADGVKAYRALFEALAARRAELGRAKAVVIDLRYNNGGSSSWSRQAAQALWGKEAVDARMDDFFKDVRIWWRASPDNVAYMSEMEAKIRGDGNAEVADGMRDVGAGMKAALAKSEPFFVEGEEKADSVRPATLPATDFRTPVYVITPGRCASACLDALDAFKRFENVRLIGAPTSGDSTYMEARSADLPSGEGRVVIPLKIWMNRPRGAGEVYTPDIQVEELDWSTANFLDRIERDLAERR